MHAYIYYKQYIQDDTCVCLQAPTEQLDDAPADSHGPEQASGSASGAVEDTEPTSKETEEPASVAIDLDSPELAKPVSPDNQLGLEESQAVSPEPSRVTGLVQIEQPPAPSPSVAEPPSPKPRAQKSRKDGPLIAAPPVLAPHVSAAAEARIGKGSVESNLEDQRELKKALDQEAKDQAEEKKRHAVEKKMKKCEDAIEKAKAKLEKAVAKAKAASKPKGKGTKRKLDSEFAAVADVDTQPAASPEKVKSIKLSPKAKAFAAAAQSSPGKKGAKKRADNRASRAVNNLEYLRTLDVADMRIPPPPFAKKILACIQLMLSSEFSSLLYNECGKQWPI